MTKTKQESLPEWLRKEMKDEERCHFCLLMSQKGRMFCDHHEANLRFNQGLVRAWELTQERITEIKAMIISYLKDGDMENDEKEYAILKHINEVFK
jgi:hypothetical protein